MVKYFFEYTSVNNVDYRCEIESDSFVGDSTEVTGYCVVEYAEVDNHFDPIRGSGMQMFLDASIDLPFDDLAVANERTYKATLERDGQIIFVGFISPEGIFEDWVNDRWTMQISVTGGLGFLENLSYVDSDGFPFEGMQTPMEIITNCLKRTGLGLNINVRLNIQYEDFVPITDGVNNNILDFLKVRTDRYYRDDGETIMDCKEVLESILNIFNACICQHNGQWWIYSPSFLLSVANNLNFYRYDSDGVRLDPAFTGYSTLRQIGSHINNATLHHCNENQRKERISSLAAFKVNYKYGLVGSLFVNEKMQLVGALGSVGSIDGWSYLNTSLITFQSYEGSNYLGFRAHRGQDDIYAGDTPLGILLSDQINVLQGEFLTFEFDTVLRKFVDAFCVKILLNTGGDVYYLDVENGWIEQGTGPTGADVIYLVGQRANVDTQNDFTVKTPAMFGDGFITVTIMQPRVFVSSPNNYVALLKRFKVYPSQDNNLEGEFHEVQRNTAVSNRVGDVLEVFNGDNESNIYYGTIYKFDEEEKTVGWELSNVVGAQTPKPILQILAEQRLKMFANVQTTFIGDVFGYFPFLSKLQISGVDGLFLPVYWSFNTLDNVTSMKLKSGNTNDIEDFTYEFTIDYGNTVKPTIKG